jgi:hypothetical protein
MADRRGRVRLAAWAGIVSFCIATGGLGRLRGDTSEREARSFQSAPLTNGVKLTYDWPAFSGDSLKVALTIPGTALAASEAEFGFTVAELREFLTEAEARIRREFRLTAPEIARRVVASGGEADWCEVDEDPENRFNFVLRSDLSGQPGRAEVIDGIILASRKAWESSQGKIVPRLEKERDGFLRSRGMIMTSRGIAADYREIVRANRVRLAPLAAEFRRACGPNRKRLLDAILSFVQGIPSRPQPPVEGERYTAGLSVPLRVLADDSGDCDSKAVLFASLWTSLCRHRTILVTVREHMLVGVAVPFASGSTLELDSIRYVLLEVNCGGRLPPGEMTAFSLDSIARGRFKYRIVS